ncbi:MFS transporter [Halioxenophilus aromaticivorans]|uniref:MFS transporter n=1 Tax=Halioxenophilus aromaticivorans TaxID=1306992 RepID=A0AAV3TX08_9ALTE
MLAPQSAIEEWKSYWFLPIAGALGYATSVIFVYALGPFIEPIEQEFGWSRQQISFGITIASFTNALLCVPIGMLVDKIGPRKVGLAGILFMGAAFALLGTATGSWSNWVMLWFVVAFAVLWIQATVWTSAVTSRFHHSRGFALAITLSGASLSATIFPLIATWIITHYDWRTGFMAMGIGWAAIVFPCLFFFFRSAKDKPKGNTQTDAVNPASLTGLSIKEGLRSGALYKLLLAGGFFAFTAIGIIVHYVPILTSYGTPRVEAAGIASLIGIFSIIGRLGTGFLLDRFPGFIVGGCAFLIPIAACALMLIDGSNTLYQMLAAAIFGLTLGSEVDVIAYLAAKYFGLRNFGALYGALVGALTMGTAFGPLAAGAVFDNYGSYEVFLMLTAVLMGISAVALFTLGTTPSAEEHAQQKTIATSERGVAGESI